MTFFKFYFLTTSELTEWPSGYSFLIRVLFPCYRIGCKAQPVISRVLCIHSDVNIQVPRTGLWLKYRLTHFFSWFYFFLSSSSHNYDELLLLQPLICWRGAAYFKLAHSLENPSGTHFHLSLCLNILELCVKIQNGIIYI